MIDDKILEEIAGKVHDAWWITKASAGFHAPMNCPESPIFGYDRQKKYCDRCHPDMVPYGILPDNIQEYDRVTVRTVLKAIEECGYEIRKVE